VGIKDLGLLAASLDELVHQEVLQRAKNVFKAKKLPMFGHIDLKQMQEVLEQVCTSDFGFEGLQAIGRLVQDGLRFQYVIQKRTV
jgi:hypothetical protein